MKCAIPGCEARSIRHSYAFCPPHWEEYGKAYGGKRANYPDWLRYLINANKQEDYADKRNARMMRSLEQLIERGFIEPDGYEPYTGPPRKRKDRKRGKRQRKNAPGAEGQHYSSAIPD